MEKQRDKQARRMQRKLARQSGATGEGGEDAEGIEGIEGVEGVEGEPVDESSTQDEAAEPQAENKNPEG